MIDLYISGQVAEWFKATVLKTVVGGSSPWVRIPPCPPISQPTLLHIQRRDYFSGVSFAPLSTFSLKLVTIESTII